MAGNETQTDLLSGWSCVVHRPSEDPEPSSLPSTVDITAFSTTPNVHPASHVDDCCSSSDSDSSENSSCSYSSSDTDSSSSTSSSSLPPQFSVTSSQTGGLRLTIATVRKGEPEGDSQSRGDCDSPVVKTPANPKLSSSDSDSDSDSESSECDKEKSVTKRDSPGRTKYVRKVSAKSVKSSEKVVRKVVKGESCKGGRGVPVRGRGRPPLRNKMASLPLPRISSPASTSGSDSSVSESNSVMLASCSLQEIRQEDLAAILPDQQEPDCDAFGGFEPSVQDASGSDMELPTQLVHAAIQRVTTGTESSSETDSQPATYASTLLQQFVQQTQLLNNNTGPGICSTEGDNKISTNTQDTTKPDSTKPDTIKRKRGRPRKNIKKPTETIEYCAEPNVSPDSGIQNSPDHLSSPEPSPLPKKNPDKTKIPDLKKSKSKKIIVQHKKIALTCNNLDRMLYANADRVLYPPRRKVGRPAGKVVRKPGRPPKHRHDIVEKTEKKISEVKKHKIGKKAKASKTDNDIVQLTSNTLSLSLGKDLKSDPVPKKIKPSGALLNEICERVSKRLELNKNGPKPVLQSTDNDDNTKEKTKTCHKPTKCVAYIKNKTKLSIMKSKLTSFKHMKVMHTKHYQKHKKHKIKILKTVTSQSAIPSKIDPDIDKLILDFVKYCNLGTNKSQKENLPEMFRCVKRLTKKRKVENSDGRKKKKQTTVNNGENKETSSNEQRLPLKKRHYHMSNNENKNSEPENTKEDLTKQTTKNGVITSTKTPVINTKIPEKSKPIPKDPEQKLDPSSPQQTPAQKSVLVMKQTTNNNNVYLRKNLDSENLVGVHIDEAIEACITRYTSVKLQNTKPEETKTIVEPKKTISTITATTPKKRHRLETENIAKNNAQIESITKKLDTNVTPTKIVEKLIELPENKSVLESVVLELKNKKSLPLVQPPENLNNSKKIDKRVETVAQMITRKKNRLEDLASNLVSKKNTQTVPDDKKIKKSEPEAEITTRASVIKSPVARKVKPAENDKLLDSIVDEKPTGIFLQTVDLELHIPASTIQITSPEPEIEKVEEQNQHNLRNKKTVDPVEPEVEKVEKIEKKAKPVVEKVIPGDKNKVLVKKKVRRRKAINRTGFPTLKKKKKKIPVLPKTETKEDIYERVPRIDEEASTFVKRQNCTLSVVSLEKLQGKTESEADIISKWEISSECDSLPMDECTFTSEFEPIKSVKSERPLSRLDIKQERMSLRLRDVSPATSVETRSSDRVKKKRDITPDTRSLDNEMKRKRDDSIDKFEKKKKFDESYRKRVRDLSPASSIEPLPSDKKQRSDSVASSSGDDMKRTKKVPKWRKKFLVAGLFSDFYKEDDESARLRRENASTKTRLLYTPSEHPYGLLPPPYHCGKYLRCRKVPFQLSHDLWWQHMHSQLPGRDLVPSWNYRKIRTNVYCIRMPSGACEAQSCNCSTTSGCEDDCINRLVLAECPSTHRCRNQRIQKHEWAPGLEKFMTENKGWGVRTKMSIKTGEFILEYVGEVVSDQEFKHRMATRYAHDTHHYCLHLDGGLVIDGHRMGGDGRFVNHSCQPNCEMQKWSVNGQFRMALFALRDITADEELTYDYNFSLFNPAEGQVCKCGSEICRGVIGGKSQRVRQLVSNTQSNNSETNNNQIGRVGRPRKNQARKAASREKEQPKEEKKEPIPVIVTPQVKPMSHQQKCFALLHHCFLLRNLDKVKRLRERSISAPRAQTISTPSAFMSQLNALRQPRNMRTRRLAQAEDNPELNKAARLASVLRDLFDLVTSSKDEHKAQLCTPFLNLPSKRKVPDYFQRISEPIDLNTIEQNIATGIYRTVEAFDSDMNKLFSNSVRFFGRTSELGISATRLRKVYNQGKVDLLKKLEDVLGEKAPPNFVGKDPNDEDEDVIRCICGLFKDEGLMIQCERCLVWQHCECVRADASSPTYHCERCVPRKVDLEIPLEEFTEHGHRYYLSLLRGTLQLRQGDTAYVLRDIPIKGTDKKHTYETIGEVKYTDLDIFRIERLWKDKNTGQRMAFGHHYLRPHETYHEPTRKFFPNEVMRVPLYEVVPIELIMSICWVLDLNTFCKGRPLSAQEDHIYICEYRVDKTARLFSKISRAKYPVCTKTYAFERFDQRIKVSRTYTPHEVQGVVKPRGRRPGEEREERKEESVTPVVRVRTREEQRAHLNGILLRLLGRMPSKQALDVSYLLEGGRRRKKLHS